MDIDETPALHAMFLEARSRNGRRDDPVDADIHAAHDIARWGPTSANCRPTRLVIAAEE